MLKALHVRGDKVILVVGLSEANVAALKQDRPIVFDLGDIGALESYPIAITYKDDDGVIGLPRGFRGRAFAFDDLALESMRRGQCREYDVEITVVVFVGKDEATMELEYRRYLGPGSLVIREGFAPSEKMPFLN